MATWLGQRLGDRFEIRKEIGSGGYATVYEAFDLEEESAVAVKIISLERLLSSAHRQAFIDEANILANLDHPNVLPLIKAGQHEFYGWSYYYIVLAFAEGGTLSQKLHDSGPLSPEQAAEVLRQIADAVDYIWERGQVAHLDLKPDNILFNAQGEVLVSDFGIARRMREGKTHTRAYTGEGSEGYMPPEQRKSGGSVGAYSDIYALGVVLHEILTGSKPGDNYENSSDPPEINDELPAAIRTVIERALENDYSQRHRYYPSATAFAVAFAKAICGEDVLVTGIALDEPTDDPKEILLRSSGLPASKPWDNRLSLADRLRPIFEQIEAKGYNPEQLLKQLYALYQFYGIDEIYDRIAMDGQKAEYLQEGLKLILLLYDYMVEIARMQGEVTPPLDADSTAYLALERHKQVFLPHCRFVMSYRHGTSYPDDRLGFAFESFIRNWIAMQLWKMTEGDEGELGPTRRHYNSDAFELRRRYGFATPKFDEKDSALPTIEQLRQWVVDRAAKVGVPQEASAIQ